MATPTLALKDTYSQETITDAWLNAVADYLDGAAVGWASVSLAGADATPAVAVYRNSKLKLTGALGAARNLILPDAWPGLWVVWHAGTGGYVATVKTVSGTGIALQQDEVALLFSDGTNILRAAAAAGANNDLTRLLALETGTASATAGAATLDKQSGTITSEALTTAAAGDYTLTLTNARISATLRVFVSLDNGSNTTAPIYTRLVTPGSGSVVIIVRNGNLVSALNGTIKINFFTL